MRKSEAMLQAAEEKVHAAQAEGSAKPIDWIKEKAEEVKEAIVGVVHPHDPRHQKNKKKPVPGEPFPSGAVCLSLRSRPKGESLRRCCSAWRLHAPSAAAAAALLLAGTGTTSPPPPAADAAGDEQAAPGPEGSPEGVTKSGEAAVVEKVEAVAGAVVHAVEEVVHEVREVLSHALAGAGDQARRHAARMKIQIQSAGREESAHLPPSAVVPSRPSLLGGSLLLDRTLRTAGC